METTTSIFSSGKPNASCMTDERNTVSLITVRKGQQWQLALTEACSQGTCVMLQYRFADMKGMHKMRLSPISAYRKKATAVHWRVMVMQISWRESQFQWKLINIQKSFWMSMSAIINKESCCLTKHKYEDLTNGKVWTQSQQLLCAPEGLQS